MRTRACESLSQRDLWTSVGINAEAPNGLWERFENGDPTVGGLQMMALWVLQDYVERNQLALG
jgi:hypothetical protein